ncbi:hypothetical protein MTO96_009239 [Rhipicephalus appendiculatus]
MSDSLPLTSCIEEWDQLEKEYCDLEKSYRQYTVLTGELQRSQDECLKALRHHRYRSSQILESLNKIQPASDDDKAQKAQLLQKLEAKRMHLDDMGQDLPRSNGIYLQIVLGSVNLFLRDTEKPDGIVYGMFRRQFTWYVCFINGFRSWMWRGLSFLLPFLYFAYVFVSAVIFFILFMGNIATTSLVIFHKISGRTIIRRIQKKRSHDHVGIGGTHARLCQYFMPVLFAFVRELSEFAFATDELTS